MLGRERKEPFLFLTTQLNKVKALSSSFFPPPSSLSLSIFPSIPVLQSLALSQRNPRAFQWLSYGQYVLLLFILFSCVCGLIWERGENASPKVDSQSSPQDSWISIGHFFFSFFFNTKQRCLNKIKVSYRLTAHNKIRKFFCYWCSHFPVLS